MGTRLVFGTFALFLVAAACGGGDDGASEGVASLSGASDDEVVAAPLAGGESVELTEEEALLTFTACMRDFGIEIEDPTVDAEGNFEFNFRSGAGPQDENFDRDAAQAAREECFGVLEGVTLGFGGEDLTEIQDTLLVYAECVRENGYDIDDPDFSNFGPGGGDGGQGQDGQFQGPFGVIDPQDPDFIAADEICSEILAGFGPRGGPGGGRRPGGDGGGNG